MAKQQAGDLKGAVPEYREFLKLHPKATAIHSNLGAALAGLGALRRGHPRVQDRAWAVSAFARAQGSISRSPITKWDASPMRPPTGRVRAEDPANLQSALLLGDCYLRIGQNKNVIRVLQPEEKKHPREYGHRLYARHGTDPRQTG